MWRLFLSRNNVETQRPRPGARHPNVAHTQQVLHLMQLRGRVPPPAQPRPSSAEPAPVMCSPAHQRRPPEYRRHHSRHHDIVMRTPGLAVICLGSAAIGSQWVQPFRHGDPIGTLDWL
eukprot:COSAG01_NODE_399_length_17543_cov_15.077792_8_plen_118_part_00